MVAIPMLSRHRASLAIAWTLAVKTLENRYARSALGLLWLLLTPLATILVYWAVFGVALGVTWPDDSGGSGLGYIVPFMVGLAIYFYFSDLVSQSLNVYVTRRNYVRKSPLPLWVLWMASFMGSSVLALINLLILFALALAQGVVTPLGIIYAVPVLGLIVLLFASLSLLLALIGPFVGDLNNGVPVVMRILFYAAPITYPLSIIPASVRPWLWLNPLTGLTEMLRETFVMGRSPSWFVFFVLLLIAIVLSLLVLFLYRRVAEAVRDVV